ncbi:MAG: carboxylesterase family protein [Methylobacter tundripaludum]|nr:carboxylesterase family protein [Methylobacter tundripaludum]
MLIKKPGKLHSTAAAVALLVLTAPNVTAAPASACTTGLVESKAGPVCGKSVTTDSGKQANAFLGIPFAESTAGDRRWKPPVPKQAWTETLEAVQYGPVCPQYAVQPSAAEAGKQLSQIHHRHAKPDSRKLSETTGQSEDCLSLNIWTPPGIKPDAKLPVMVFIYGGGFSEGESSDPLYDGSFLAANKNVILVSFNYRLGVLGFLATNELSGNYGFMDQQLALSWVQNSIRDFGGDPGKVTIFGESAGAMSVGLHLFSAPGSAKLFRAGIMESNFLALPYKRLEDQVNVGNVFKQGLNCRDLKCLQNTNVNDLLLAQDAFIPKMSTVFSGAKYYIPFTPVIDGVLLTRQPVVAAAERRANKPILLGTNKNESVLFVNGQSITPADYSAWTASLFGLDFQKAIAKYPAQNDSSNSALWARIQTDNFLRCSSRYVAANAAAPVYAYLFNHQPSFQVWGGPDCRADDNVCHGAELPFVFHSADKIGGRFTAEEEVLSNTIIDYWVNFATYLNPNGDPAASPVGVRWPQFSRHKKDYMGLNAPEVSVQNDPYREVCDFWDGIGYNLVEPWAAKPMK